MPDSASYPDPKTSQPFGEAISSHIQKSPLLLPWFKLRQHLATWLDDDPDWIVALPMTACEAVGGDPAEAVPAAAAWDLLRYAAHLLDGVQDQALPPEIKDDSQALAYAHALIFAAFGFLEDLSSQETAARITTIFSTSSLLSLKGYYEEQLQKEAGLRPESSLEDYWGCVILKSGSIYRAATSAGAAVATTSDDIIEAVGDYGSALGVILQVKDDCRDFYIDVHAADKFLKLPALLFLAGSQEGSTEAFEQLSPEILRARFINAGIPAAVGALLLEWRKKGAGSLGTITGSLVNTHLESIIHMATLTE